MRELTSGSGYSNSASDANTFRNCSSIFSALATALSVLDLSFSLFSFSGSLDPFTCKELAILSDCACAGSMVGVNRSLESPSSVR